jgi:hypothetical protein
MKYLLLILVLSFSIYSDTHTASSVARADVATAITAATDGDSVHIPAGSATWTSGIVVTAGVRIGGMGRANTVINSGLSSGSIFQYNAATPIKDSLFSIQHMTLRGNQTAECSGITLTHTGDTNYVKNVLVYDLRLTKFSGGGESEPIILYGNVYGVVSHCRIDSCGQVFRLLGNDANSWAVPVATGTYKYLYMEDDSIVMGGGGYITDSGWGSRWVIRHCWFDMTLRDFGAFDAHGNWSSTRGTISSFIYENTLVNVVSGYGGFVFMDLRGGTAGVYNNTCTGTESRGDITIREEDCTSGGSYVDCTYPGTDPIQNSYFWNNPYNSEKQVLGLGGSNETATMITEDVDWWDDMGSSDNNFTWGVYSSRPSSCATNDCYWATDTKTLYRAVATNDWDSVYHEYAYPHPLTSGSAVVDPPSNSKKRNIFRVKR